MHEFKVVSMAWWKHQEDAHQVTALGSKDQLTYKEAVRKSILSRGSIYAKVKIGQVEQVALIAEEADFNALPAETMLFTAPYDQ